MSQHIRTYFTRPHRQAYYPFDLGPAIILLNNKRYTRQDFQIRNLSNNQLSVSFFSCPQEPSENCVVYLHTHNGSKLEALPLTQSVLSTGFNFCLFDFAGYGNSEGQTVSLGCRQIWDIDCVLRHLHSEFSQFKAVLWGRSMGAAAALLYLATKAQMKEQGSYLEIIGGLYDSPFHSLERLTLEIGAKSVNLPEFVVNPIVKLVKNSLKEEIDFAQLELSQKVNLITIPGIFLASRLDNFVNCSHSQTLYKNYRGKKELVYIERDHNQVRKQEDLGLAFAFLRKLTEENPKRWQIILMNNLHYQRKNGISINKFTSPRHF